MPEVIDINTFFGVAPGSEDDWSLDALLRLLDHHEVERALTCSLRGVYFDFVEGNNETLAAARSHNNLVPVGTIDPRRYLDCLEEVRRCASEGIKVFRFFPDVQGWAIDGLHFLRVVEAIAEANGAVMLPCAAAGWASTAARVLGPIGIPAVLLGAGYSFFAELLAAMEACPTIYCDGHKLDSPGACELICQEVGEERMMFGSGLPERYFSSAYLMVEKAELTPHQRRRILHDNAARVLLGEEA